MGRWVDQVWEAGGHASEAVRYRCYDPSPLRGLIMQILPPLSLRAHLVENKMREVAHASDAASGEWMVRHTEASSSTSIEGIYPSPRGLARAEVAGPKRESAEASALRHAAATDLALSIGEAQNGPVTVDDICAIHAVLTDGDEEFCRHHEPGALRESQNWIGGGNLGSTPADAEFVSPPAGSVPALMEDLAGYINDAHDPPLVLSAVAHARFEHIHPFPDGNGRTGRALAHLIWARAGLVTATSTIPFSAYFARNKGEYFAMLAAAHKAVTEGADGVEAFGPAVEMFAEAADQASNLTRLMRSRVAGLMDDWQQTVGVRPESVAGRLLADLPRRPVVEVSDLAARYGCSERSAQQAVKTLTDVGVLEERSLGKGRRGHEATALLDLYSAATQGDNPALRMEDVHRTERQRINGNDSNGRPGPREKAPCGAWMPIAQARCVLREGHAGPHRRG